MENNKQIDDIVAAIDRFMAADGGHLDISVENTEDALFRKEVTTQPSLDCVGRPMACQVPTLHQGLDTDEEDN